MGSLVHAGFLDENKKLTPEARDMFIREVKELIVYGSEDLPIPTPFTCGDPIPPASPSLTMENFKLEDPTLYNSFHVDIVQNRYEKLLVMLDVDPNFSLLPMMADPIALAGSAFSVNLPPMAFPSGFAPYLAGALVPKLFIDLLKRGVDDFLTPADLAKKLAELVSVPKPPIPIPIVPLPTPATPDLPAVEPPPLVPPGLPESLTLPDVPVPTPPSIALSEVIARDVSMITGVPEFMMQVVGKIPAFAPKLGNVSSIFSELCKMVRDSGIFPQTHPENDIERAANTVMARRLAETAMLSSISVTLGSSNGSIVSSIAQDPIGLKPPPPPEPDLPSKTPNQIVYEFALKAQNGPDGGGLSFGKNEQLYSSLLFYYESSIVSCMPGTVSLLGTMYPTELDGRPTASGIFEPLPKNATRALIKNSVDLWGKVGVTTPTGFLKYVNWAAKDASSCGLFGRACYFNAGVVNRFFNDLYPPSRAIYGMVFIGYFRNYKWIKDDYTYNEELGQLASIGGPGWPVTGIVTQETSVNLIDVWGVDLDEQGSIKSRDSRLTPHLRTTKVEELAYYDEELLSQMAQRGIAFPKIEAGDIMLTQAVNSNNVPLIGAEHMMVITKPNTLAHQGGKPHQINFKGKSPDGKMWVLSDPVDVVHGGQPDEFNVEEDDSPAAKKRKEDASILAETFEKALKSAPLIGGLATQIINGVPKPVKPTAIRGGLMDLGFVSSDAKDAGFYLTSSRQVTTSGTLGKKLEPGQLSANPPNGKRKIVSLFKTRYYADPIENGDVSSIKDPDARRSALSAAGRAANTIDEHPIMLWIMKVLQDKRRMTNLVKVTFADLPSGE